MEQGNRMILEEMRRRLGELTAEAEHGGMAVPVTEWTREEKLQMHYAGTRVDVDTKGTFQEEDAALLANLKRYRAASINIEDADERILYGKVLDAAAECYDRYAGLKEIERQARSLIGSDDVRISAAQSFLVRIQALILETVRAEEENRRNVQLIERFCRLTASKKGADDEETFAYKLRSEEEFPENFRKTLANHDLPWEKIAAMGEDLHSHPPVLKRALFVVDGYSGEQAEPFLTRKGTDETFRVEDPYAVRFAVSNFDNAMQPLFSTAQVRMLREQKKSMYDMIFVEGTSAKELYGPLIAKDQDAKQRGNEIKMRIFADLLSGKHAEVSNGEQFLPISVRIEMPEVNEVIRARELEAMWSEERIEAMIDEEGRRLMEWIDQLQEKMWGVVSEALEEHPDGIEDEEEIQEWLDGLFELDET